MSILSCDKRKNYTLVSPEHQILPYGKMVANPFYEEESITEYWGYKLLISSNAVEPVTDIYIPISDCIRAEGIEVREKILSLDSEEVISFDLITLSEYQCKRAINLLHIPINERFSNAESVFYTIAVKGHYEGEKEVIYLKSDNQMIPTEEVKTPMTPLSESIVVNNHCEIQITDNNGMIHFRVTVLNNGSKNLKNIELSHKIKFCRSEITLGQIQCESEYITISEEVLGGIIVTWRRDSLNVGEFVTFTYAFPVLNVESPGEFEFFNSTLVESEGVSSVYTSKEVLNVIEYYPELNFKKVSDDSVILEASLKNIYPSPESKALLKIEMNIPPNLNIMVRDFFGYDARLCRGKGKAFRNTPISDETLMIIIPAEMVLNSTFTLSLEIKFTSLGNVLLRDASIQATLNYVFPYDKCNKVILRDSPSPVVSCLKINGDVISFTD